MSILEPNTGTLEQIAEKVATRESEGYKIVLYNDEVNTFDWVIECLMKVCAHTSEQAEQCAWIVHHKGKYPVKHGDLTELRPRCEALCDRGLSAQIEE